MKYLLILQVFLLCAIGTSGKALLKAVETFHSGEMASEDKGKGEEKTEGAKQETEEMSKEEKEEQDARNIAKKINALCPTDGVITDGILTTNQCEPNREERRKHTGEKDQDIQEGDMLVKKFHRRRRVAVNMKWPTSSDSNVYIPYVFETSIRNVTDAFLLGAREYERLTCIRFRPRRSETNYIAVISSSGCFTYAGMVGGRQPLSLQAFTFCAHKGVAIHEQMHVIGFLHTMARRDRDKFITIHFNNIPFNLQRQFRMHDEGAGFVMGIPYDKQSVMQYGNRAGSFAGTNAMTSKSNPNEKLGQTIGFSPSDLAQVNRLYCPSYVPNKP